MARGFRHLVFDDNYLAGGGDNFSPRTACAASHVSPERGRHVYKDPSMEWEMSAAEMQRLGRSFRAAVATYAAGLGMNTLELS
jgi:hypothetical protein